MQRDRGIKGRVQAMGQLLRAVALPQARSVPPAQSVGLVLACEVRGACEIPEMASSRRDGYALRAAETVPAASGVPVELGVAGLIPAETVAPAPLAPGTAMRVLTGGPIPPGADSVVADEDVAADNDTVVLTSAVEPGQYVLSAGGDFPLHSLIGEQGQPVTPQMAAVMVRSRVRQVQVRPRPRAAVVVIGSELTDPYGDHANGRMPADNAVLASELLAGAGFDVVSRVVLEDDASVLGDHLQGVDADLVVTTGGTGRSERDVARKGVRLAGFETIFHGVDMRPGKGMFAAGREGSLLLGLPGPPGAVFACLHGFLPALGSFMRGLGRPEAVMATVEGGIVSRKSGDWLVPCVARTFDTGVVVNPLADASLTSFEVLARAHGVIVVPGGMDIPPGGKAELLLLHF